ncbi:MAG: DUF2332 domain-containing protein [Paracoccus sp. (in: a-proteobacteria)]|uniref:DUF2332 domain-containing protein n=1 Tax=Paracoccus sp. TaxID=267 RepID=UPI0039E53D27
MSAWRDACALQAEACRALGSPLTARICEILAEALDRPLVDRLASPLARRIRDWKGDITYHGASLPLRLCGALQGLVLTGRSPRLASLPADELKSHIIYIIQEYETWFLDWIELAPQTNEVGRSSVLLAAAGFLAGLSPARFDLLELGASAGLNLNFPLYSIVSENINNSSSEDVILTPEWRGARPDLRPLRVGAARGVDLHPLDPQRDGLRLQAYIWPDQPARLARMQAALALAQSRPPVVDRGDAADWLERQLAHQAPHGRLIFHTVAAQYFPDTTRQRIEAAMQAAGTCADADHPLAHVSMEGGGPRGMALDLRLWDGNGMRSWRLGHAQAHGGWIDWQPQEKA